MDKTSFPSHYQMERLELQLDWLLSQAGNARHLFAGKFLSYNGYNTGIQKFPGSLFSKKWK